MYTCNVEDYKFGDVEIDNIQIEHITDHDDGFVMVFFDLVTEHGRVNLQEHLNYDSDGNFESVERVDSNIACNMESEFCSVFDMSEKTPMLPDMAYVPFYEVIDAVEEAIMEFPRQQRRDPRRRLEDLYD